MAHLQSMADLADEEVTLVALRLQDHGLVEIASEVGKAASTVCHRLQQLGEDLARPRAALGPEASPQDAGQAWQRPEERTMPWLKRVLSSPLVRQMLVAALLFAAEVIKQNRKKQEKK